MEEDYKLEEGGNEELENKRGKSEVERRKKWKRRDGKKGENVKEQELVVERRKVVVRYETERSREGIQ